MSQEKENAFVFCGIVDAAPQFQFNESGKCKGRLKIKRNETWNGGSKDICLEFSFYGKPAEDTMALDLKLGTAVRVTGSFGSYEAKNKAGELLGFHNPALNAWRVDVRTAQPQSAPPSNDDISF